jgi:hypothetical protein
MYLRGTEETTNVREGTEGGRQFLQARLECLAGVSKEVVERGRDGPAVKLGSIFQSGDPGKG